MTTWMGSGSQFVSTMATIGMFSLLASVTAMCSFLQSMTKTAPGRRFISAMPGEVVLEALEVVLRVVGLLAAHPLEVTALLHDAKLGEAAQAALDDLEVGEHPAHPAVGDVGLPGVVADLLDDVLSLLLGTDEEDLLAAPDDVSQVFAGDVELLLGLLEVDDVDPVSRREDVRAHPGIPAAGLMAEMDSGLEQLTQCYCRHGRSLLLGWCGASVRGEPRRRPGGTGHPPAA